MCAIAVPAAATLAQPTTYSTGPYRVEAQSWTYLPILARAQLPDGSTATSAHSVLAIPDPATRTGDNFIAVWYSPDPAQPTGWSALAWNTRTTLEKVYAQIATQLDIPDDPTLDEWPHVPELAPQDIFAEDLPFPLINGVSADDPLAPVLGALPPENQSEIVNALVPEGYGIDDGTQPLLVDTQAEFVPIDPLRVFGRGLNCIANAAPITDDMTLFARVFQSEIYEGGGQEFGTPGPAASALLNDPGFIGDSGTNNTDEANSFDNCQDASHLLQFGPAGPLDDANGDGYPDWLVLGLKPSAVNDGSPPSIYDLLLADGYGFDSSGALRLCEQQTATPCAVKFRVKTTFGYTKPATPGVPTKWFLVDQTTDTKTNRITCIYERYSDDKDYLTHEIICLGGSDCATELSKFIMRQYVGTIQRVLCSPKEPRKSCPANVPDSASNLDESPGCTREAFNAGFVPNHTDDRRIPVNTPRPVPLINPCQYKVTG